MSVHELADRVRQAAMARVDGWRHGRTYDFADLPENSGPEGTFFFTAEQLPRLCDLLNQRFPATVRSIISRAERILRHQFDLLGYENLDFGPEIDWHLDFIHGKSAPRKLASKVKYLDFEEVGDSKITWELNRHQHLVTLAKAYRLTGDARFGEELIAQWQDWQVKNPYPVGINWASSLEVAFRSLSWIWVYFLLSDTLVFTPRIRREFVRAIAISGRHIDTYPSTYFSPNTHLLGEALALFATGLLFPAFPRATRWKQRGWNIVQEAAAHHVRQDGFYFEQSTYYHVYALDMFLHARILAHANGIPVPSEFDQTLVRMLDVLCMLGRAGSLPVIGDDDGGRLFDGRRNRREHLLDPLSTGAALFQRGDFKFFMGSVREETLWLLGQKGLDDFESLKICDPSVESAGMPASGLYLLADVEGGQQLFFDAGPHGPGHGHADALSIQLIRNGRTLLMDPGTYEYIGQSGLRQVYRGTSAHNTLRVDGLDQAEAKGPFGWGPSPQVRVEQWATGSCFNWISASHNGYARLPDAVIHCRSVFQRKGQFWLVRDVALGQGQHDLELSWHLGPGLSPVSTKDNVFAEGEETLALMTVDGCGWAQSASRMEWSPVYGAKERAIVVTLTREGTLPAEFVTLLLPDADLRTGIGRLERLPSVAGVNAYRYVRENREHFFFFADHMGSWNLGCWTSDARFLYWSWDRQHDVKLLVLCSGTYVEIQGVRVVASPQKLDYAELISTAGETELRSSDPEQTVMNGSLDRIEMDLAALGTQQGTGA
jgi:hypothetical protein